MATARELLLAEQRRTRERAAALEREFAGLAEAASSAGTDDEHDPEGATLAFERQHAAALLEAAREQLAAIDAALGRLEAGRYGRCERCGQPIGADRLAARPTALTCIRCALASRYPPQPFPCCVRVTRGRQDGPFGMKRLLILRISGPGPGR